MLRRVSMMFSSDHTFNGQPSTYSARSPID
jgi:hypothetical protein